MVGRSVLDRDQFVLFAFAENGVIAVAAVDQGEGGGFAQADGIVAVGGVDGKLFDFFGGEQEGVGVVHPNADLAASAGDSNIVVASAAKNFERAAGEEG